jgi:hypothetical protein
MSRKRTTYTADFKTHELDYLLLHICKYETFNLKLPQGILVSLH